ncbi:MAG: PQQ-binding-like beta-propeller repeat protein [Candidatus Bathyarchaeia archaeon]|jgi:outer membrane protein assembly factor BamB
MEVSRKISGLLFTAIFLLSTVSALPAPATGTNIASMGDDWPMVQHDPEHTGATNSSVPIAKPHVLWSVPYGSYVASPVVANGIVYIDSNAYNADTGKLLWANTSVEFTPLIENDIIYAVTPGTFGIHAYNASTGATLTGSSSIFNATILAVGDGYFYGMNEGCLVDYNIASGNLIWKSANYSYVYDSPAVADGCLYFGTEDNFVALNASTGTQTWEFPSPTPVSFSPAVSSGFVYVKVNAVLYCFNDSTGKPVWNYAVDAPYLGSSSYPAVANGIVYIGAYDGNVYAINAYSGEKVWSSKIAEAGGGIDKGVQASPIVVGGMVLVCSTDGNLYALNCSDGNTLWTFRLQSSNPRFGDYLASSPAVADGKIYIGSVDYQIIVLGNSNQSNVALSRQWVQLTVVVLVVVGVIILIAVVAKQVRNKKQRIKAQKNAASENSKVSVRTGTDGTNQTRRFTVL